MTDASASPSISAGFLKPTLVATAIGTSIAPFLWHLSPGLSLALPLLAAASAIDLRDRLLPDTLTLPAIALAAIGTSLSARDANASLLGIAAALLLGSVMGIIRPRGFGLGDAKLLAAIGAAGGLEEFCLSLTVGAIAGTLYALCSAETRRNGIPAGPWLLGGAVLSALFSPFFALIPHLSLPVW